MLHDKKKKHRPNLSVFFYAFGGVISGKIVRKYAKNNKNARKKQKICEKICIYEIKAVPLRQI